jgi:predicted AAA+ superfamily ATPase
VITHLLRKKSDFIGFWKKKNGTEIDCVRKNIFNNTHTVAEIKNQSTDNVPKVFFNFKEKYPQTNSIVFNQDQYKTRGETLFIPYRLIETLTL